MSSDRVRTNSTSLFCFFGIYVFVKIGFDAINTIFFLKIKNVAINKKIPKLKNDARIKYKQIYFCNILSLFETIKLIRQKIKDEIFKTCKTAISHYKIYINCDITFLKKVSCNFEAAFCCTIYSL